MRKRDATRTQEAILDSARKLFAQFGYQGVGVREIAAKAGVTAMLVNRYFGSKEKLFIAAAKASIKEPVILSKDNINSPDVAKAMVRALIQITKAKDTPLDGFQILLRSAGAPGSTKLGRKIVEDGHHKTLKAFLKGKSVGVRAAVLLSFVAGFQIMRQMIELTDLTEATDNELEKILTPIFEQLIKPV